MIAGVVCVNQNLRTNMSAMLAIGLVPLCVHAGQASLFTELRQPGKPALKVRMTEPVVVAVASRPEKWGFFQFPSLALVFSAGRPGVQLRFCADGSGATWSEPLELLPYAQEKEQVSCGHTSLLATGPDRFLIIYSDFKYHTPSGEIRKAIKVGEVIVSPDSAKRLQAPKWRD
jgi:hypothetical protein